MRCGKAGGPPRVAQGVTVTFIDPRLPVFYVFSPQNDDGFGTLDRFFLLGSGPQHWSFPAKASWDGSGAFIAESLQGNRSLASAQMHAAFPVGEHAAVGYTEEAFRTSEGNELAQVSFRGIAIRDAEDPFAKYGSLYACAAAALSREK
jgi:hypothetical protein